MQRLNQRGSHIVLISLGIVVLAVAGFAGYRVLHKSPADVGKIGNFTLPASITSKTDLQKAATSLDQSGTELDTSLSSDSLNASLDDLL